MSVRWTARGSAVNIGEIRFLVFGIAAKQVDPGCHYNIQIDYAGVTLLPFALGRPSQFANAA